MWLTRLVLLYFIRLNQFACIFFGLYLGNGITMLLTKFFVGIHFFFNGAGQQIIYRWQIIAHLRPTDITISANRTDIKYQTFEAINRCGTRCMGSFKTVLSPNFNTMTNEYKTTRYHGAIDVSINYNGYAVLIYI